MITWPDAIEFHRRTWWLMEPGKNTCQYDDRRGSSLMLTVDESSAVRQWSASVLRSLLFRNTRVMVVALERATMADALAFLDTAMTEVGL